MIRLSNNEIKAIRQIRNSLMHRGRSPSIRELMHSLGYKSPRSAALIIAQLINKGFLRRRSDGSIQIVKHLGIDTSHAQTINVPLIGVVACGSPVIAEENVEAMIPVSTKLAKPPYKYFILRANGDSMNERSINHGDLILVRHQVTANNGDIVVALIDGEVTIKEFYISKDTIVLKPRSTNKQHKPIILSRDFQIQGIVITTIPKI